MVDVYNLVFVKLFVCLLKTVNISLIGFYEVFKVGGSTTISRPSNQYIWHLFLG